MKKLILIFFIIFLSISVSAEDSPLVLSPYKYSPTEIIGKTFIFAAPTIPFVADCFYTEEGVLKKDFSKKNRFAPYSKGITPDSEFLNRQFTALKLMPIKNYNNAPSDSYLDINDGFILLLKRDDGVTIGLKFNKSKPNKRFSASNPPSFSDLFFHSSYKEGFPDFFTGKPQKLWETFISIPVFDVNSINAVCDSLQIPYFQDKVYNGVTSKINNYKLLSLDINSNSVGGNFLLNDSIPLTLSLSDILSTNASRTMDVRKASEIQKMIDLYDKDQINYIRERLVGKSVWAGIRLTHDFSCIYRDLDKQTAYSDYILWRGRNYDRVFDAAKPRHWFEKCEGTASCSFKSSFLNVMDGMHTVNVIVEDLILAESFYNGPSGTKYKKPGTISGNDYRFMLVLKQNPEKTYGSNKDESRTRIYVMFDDDHDITKYFYSDIENEVLLAEAQNREQERNRNWQADFDARFSVANRLWGQDIANVIKRGEVQFGFTPDMCLLSYHDSPFRVYNASTPLGTAICYDFYEESNRLFFINNELIGVQFKLGDIRYK